MSRRRRKALFIVGILLAQTAFVAYGLFLVFWVLNEWFAERPLNAIFGIGLGLGLFFAAWFRGRDWARGFYRRNFTETDPGSARR